MDIISLLAEAWNTGFWGSIIGWFYDFIGNYGWTIILFTIVLKVCLMPLDFWQRRTARKNAEIQKIIKPELDKIREKYANQPDKLNQKLNEKQMELFKKHNYNIMGSCGVMLLNMVLTMVVFFTLFASLGTIANKQIANQYESLNAEYVKVMEDTTVDKSLAETAKSNAMVEAENVSKAQEIYDDLIAKGSIEEDATKAKNAYLEKVGEKAYYDVILTSGNKDSAQSAVLELWNSGEVTESWLWVKNVWKGDTATTSVPTYKEYISMAKVSEEDLSETRYNDVMAKVVAENQGWNGCYILILLSGVITLFSQLLMTGAFKKGEDRMPGNKFLMILLPAIMILFTLSTNAIFAMYVCANALFSALITPLYNVIFDSLDKRKKKKATESVVVDYKIQKFNDTTKTKKWR